MIKFINSQMILVKILNKNVCSPSHLFCPKYSCCNDKSVYNDTFYINDNNYTMFFHNEYAFLV